MLEYIVMSIFVNQTYVEPYLKVFSGIKKKDFMMNKIIQKTETTITLKEITDLISIEHNKAMKQVEKLRREPSFGRVEKIATPTYNPNGSFNKNIYTYQLNKKQAIATGAKLNNSLLMKVIDRLEELEIEISSENTSILPDFRNPVEMARAWANELEQKQRALQTVKAKDEVILAVADLNIKAGDVLIGDFAKNLAIKGLGQNNIFKWLKARGYLMENTRPYQQYVNRGYFVRKPSVKKINGEVRYTTMLTARGTTWLAGLLRADFEITEDVA